MVLRILSRSRSAAAFALAVALVGDAAPAQGRKADYERAKNVRLRWSGKLVRFEPELHWPADESALWWKEQTPNGATRYVSIDTATGRRRTATTRKGIGLPGGPTVLSPRASKRRSLDRGGLATIIFENRLKRSVQLFWVGYDGSRRASGTLEPGQKKKQATRAGHVWMVDGAADERCGIFIAENGEATAVIDAASRRAAQPEPSDSSTPSATPRVSGERETGARSPGKSRYRVEIRDHNVVGIDRDGESFRLTKDGTAKETYTAPQSWSPDGTKVLGFRVSSGQSRRISFRESAPVDRVQPRKHEVRYAKPGDRIDHRRPRLFDLKKRRVIKIEDGAFEDAWRIDHVRWAPDGSRVFCVYNRRGHQRVAVIAIDAKTGKVEAVVDETSRTFIDYSQKLFVHWLPETGQLLWASERDGWNHVYRFDTDGTLVNQVTHGRWVVREVLRVDEERGQLWFTAMGIHVGQDPYHRHLARIDLDGKNLKVLTKGDGTHTWKFSPSRRFFVDRWSRVDQPTVTELRRSENGSLVAELGRDDASALYAAGFRPPQRFVAKGRDGKTDIHGIIIRPSTFDPKRQTTRYPVIEHIYAGPHDHHVPKSFTLSLRQRMLAELGFVVVQIDGMGTNWRSKAFHDLCFQNLKDAGLPDRIAWIRAAVRAHPEIAIDRVGIYGASAGGQNALAALLHYGDFYDAAVADCGCHDNRMSRIRWSEAWMGKVGPHYAANSNVTHASKLSGKLLLTVGELDRNVDPASTMQVVGALIRADKDFELVVMPGAGHGAGDLPYLVRRRQDFFVRALLGVEPRR
jgi:dipeptidyl aminopeptidase/acylaminoacyl peptidase